MNKYCDNDDDDDENDDNGHVFISYIYIDISNINTCCVGYNKEEKKRVNYF